MRPARLLILRGGAIGDFIVTLPALAALRARWPDAHIEVIGYPHIARIAHAAGLINHVRSLHDGSLARYFAPDAPIRDEDQAYFSSFDFIVNYLHDPQEHLAENLRRCGVQVMLNASPIVTDGHAVDHFLKPLESLAIYDSPREPALPADGGMMKPVHEAPWIAIHPGSGSRSKNWPLDHFLAIAQRCSTHLGWQPVFFTGDAEREYISDLDARLRGNIRHHNLELPDLARHFTRATAYVGNDSGISHLAAATGCPSLVLFGPSDPAIWSPRGRQVRIVAAPGGDLDRLSVDTAWSALTQLRGVDAPP